MIDMTSALFSARFVREAQHRRYCTREPAGNRHLAGNRVQACWANLADADGFYLGEKGTTIAHEQGERSMMPAARTEPVSVRLVSPARTNSPFGQSVY